VLRVVLDTNQLVSSLIATRGLQRQLIDAWRQRAYLLLVGPRQVDEAGEVLRRDKIAKKYPITPGDREGFLQLLRQDALLLAEAPAPGVCRDPDDDALLGCAAAGGADYLVTGDDDLMSVRRYGGVAVVSAREFLAVLST